MDSDGKTEILSHHCETWHCNNFSHWLGAYLDLIPVIAKPLLNSLVQNQIW